MFDRSQNAFPSNAHRLVWYLGVSQLPFVGIPPEPGDSEIARQLIEGEESLHKFLSSVYRDAYEHPAEYRLAETEDLTFRDGEWYKHRPDMAQAMRKNAHLMKSFEVLFDVIHYAEFQHDILLVSSKTFDEAFDRITPKAVSRPKIKAVINAFARHGLKVEEIEDRAVIEIRSNRHPHLLTALKAMCGHRSGDVRERVFALQRCDFAAIHESYRPEIRSVFSVLPDETRRQAEEIVEHMQRSGYRTQFSMGGYPSAMWSITFDGKKGKKAGSFLTIGFSIEYEHMFHASLHCMNPQHLIPIVHAHGAQYARWFSNMWKRECNGCGYCKKFKNPGPYLFEVEGKRRRLCHQNWITKRNPTDSELTDLLGMVDLHTESGLVAV